MALTVEPPPAGGLPASAVPADHRLVWVAPVAGTVALLSVACSVAAVVLAVWVRARGVAAPLNGGDLVLGTAWPVAGALVLRAAPRNAVGWVLLSGALLGPYLLLGYYAAASDTAVDGGLPGATVAAWFAVWGFAPYFVVLPMLLLLFPDGRALSPRWRLLVITLLTTAAVTTLARMLSPVPTDLAPTVLNPLAVPWPPLRQVTMVGATVCVVGGTVAGVGSLLLRTRRATGVARTQLQWLVLGGILLLVGFLMPPDGAIGAVAGGVGMAAPPVAVTVAILRHGLFDVELVLNRTIVLAVLSAGVVAAYAGVVLLAGSLGATSGPALLVVGLAALAAASGRSAVQASVDRWLFGHRGDPYAVVSRVGRHIAPAAEPVEALGLLVDALRRALRLPYVAFWDDASQGVVAEAGTPLAGWHAVPAHALGQHVGELRAGLRRRGERLGQEELEAVAEVAARAGTLAYAARLVGDVAESRARIVAAREEERRRLRDDLHDELGPTLAGAAHQLDALARRLRAAGDIEGADRATALRDQMRGTVADVRSIVHGLRPPVLDQRGLAGALSGLLEGLDRPVCRLELDLPDPVPAAVEVAAYAIAAEAVANALRHSAGSALVLAAAVRDGMLVLEVRDNGQGVQPRRGHGVGLRSIGERAAEVGGRLDILETLGGGTTVRASLPVGKALS